MSLLEPNIIVTLTPAEYALVTKPTDVQDDKGGWQRLLDDIKFESDVWHYRISDQQAQRIYRYAYTGTGGYQMRFRALYRALIRAGWVAP